MNKKVIEKSKLKIPLGARFKNSGSRCPSICDFVITSFLFEVFRAVHQWVILW